MVLDVPIQLLFRLFCDSKFDMGEDHDNFSNFDVNYLIIIIFDFTSKKLFKIWPKKEFYNVRKEYSSKIEPLRGIGMKLVYRRKIYLILLID